MKLQSSAGGIVYKKETGKVWILLARHSQYHQWVFPRGLIGDHKKGETKEETALREVKEETGAEAKIIQELPPETYWFKLKGALIKKTVYYYLMEYISGDITKHDFEMEKVEWVASDEVEKWLTYSKKIWEEARKIISEMD